MAFTEFTLSDLDTEHQRWSQREELKGTTHQTLDILPATASILSISVSFCPSDSLILGTEMPVAQSRNIGFDSVRLLALPDRSSVYAKFILYEELESLWLGKGLKWKIFDVKVLNYSIICLRGLEDKLIPDGRPSSRLLNQTPFSTAT